MTEYKTGRTETVLPRLSVGEGSVTGGIVKCPAYNRHWNYRSAVSSETMRAMAGKLQMPLSPKLGQTLERKRRFTLSILGAACVLVVVMKGKR